MTDGRARDALAEAFLADHYERRIRRAAEEHRSRARRHEEHGDAVLATVEDMVADELMALICWDEGDEGDEGYIPEKRAEKKQGGTLRGYSPLPQGSVRKSIVHPLDDYSNCMASPFFHPNLLYKAIHDKLYILQGRYSYCP